MWEKFTTSSKRIIKHAHEEAKYAHSDVVGTEHLLLGLLKDEQSFGVKILKRLDVDIEKLRSEVIHGLPPGSYDFENLNFSKASKKVLEKAYQNARQLRHSDIGSEHILLALLEVKEGKACEILNRFQVEYLLAKKHLIEIRSNGKSDLDILEFSKHSKQALEFAHDEAKKQEDKLVHPEHILLGLLRIEDSKANEILNSHGITYDAVKEIILEKGKGESEGSEE